MASMPEALPAAIRSVSRSIKARRRWNSRQGISFEKSEAAG
jgi:hypothetical protein